MNTIKKLVLLFGLFLGLAPFASAQTILTTHAVPSASGRARSTEPRHRQHERCNRGFRHRNQRTCSQHFTRQRDHGHVRGAVLPLH